MCDKRECQHSQSKLDETKISRQVNEKRTPMLSTSILSRPKGPNELLTIFAIDCAAITITIQIYTQSIPFREHHIDVKVSDRVDF